MPSNRSLQFSSDGSRLWVAGDDELHAVDLANTSATTTTAVPGLVDFVVTDRDVWTISGTPRAARVIGHAGEALISGSVGRLIAGIGAQVVWLSEAAVLLATSPLGITARPMSAVDHAVPLSATRMLVAAGSTLQLRDGSATRWSIDVGSGTVEEAAPVLDGRALAAFVRGRLERSIVIVVNPRDGAVQHRIGLDGAHIARFAAQRGVAAVVIEQRRVVLIDLRFGRVLADHEVEPGIVDLAIDDAGTQLAVRRAGGAIERLEVAELMRTPAIATPVIAATPLPLDEPEPCAPPASNGAVDHEPVAAPGGPLELPSIRALPRRVVVTPPTTDEQHRLLDAQRDLVMALCAYAIAAGWNEGRIALDAPLASADEVAGLVRAVRGLAQDEIMDTARRVDEAFAEWNRVVAQIAPRCAPIHALADEHQLSLVEQLVLTVVAAPALWGELARLFGILIADRARPLCDEHLVGQILAPLASPHDIARALEPTARLATRGLVRAESGLARPFQALVADAVVIALLRGLTAIEACTRTELRPATRTFAELQLPDETRHAVVDQLAAAVSPLRIVVHGRAGSGRHSLLAAIAAATGRELAVIDVAGLARGSSRIVEDLAVALRRAHVAGYVPCLDGLEGLQDPSVRAALRELLDSHFGPITVRLPVELRAPLAPGHVDLVVPPQTITERSHAWDVALGRAGITGLDVAELGAKFSVGPGVIDRVVTDLALRTNTITGEQVAAAIHQHLDASLSAVATRVTRLATWSQVVLPADVQDSIGELIGRIRHRRTVFDDWGFDAVMSTSRGVTALFQGGPGTGKTLVAGAIANELGLDLYRVDVSRITSKWVGETEQNLAKLFDAAEDGNAMILFDEADTLFARRTEVKSSNDRYANSEVNYLLQRLDSFEGIAILTTNFGTSIDNAFKRRLSFRLTFPFPDEDQRERLWRAHIPARAPTRGDLALPELSRRYKMSGGYIRNCALRAAFLAAEQGSPLTADHFERAIKAEYREIGNLADSGVLE